jgi:hypothetical protein
VTALAIDAREGLNLMVRWPVWMEVSERDPMPTAHILTHGDRVVRFSAGSESKGQKCKETNKVTNGRKKIKKQTKRQKI